MDTKRFKVLFLPKWYPNRLDPFDGNFIENHARAIADKHEIAILFVHSDTNILGKYELIESSTFGYTEIRVYYRKPGFRFLGLQKLLALYRYCRAQFKAFQLYQAKHGYPDLCHIHVLTRPAFLAFYLHIYKSIPYLISEHWSGYFKESGAYKGWLKKITTQLLVSRAKAISCVSEYLMYAMKTHHLNGNYKIIPNVVSTAVFRPVEKNIRSTKTIIHVSTLDIVPKNLPAVFHTINKIIQYRTDFKLAIYGDGKDRNALEKLVEQMGLHKYVQFHGNVSQEKVAAAMAEADFLLLFSLYENQPCVIIEAMACGIPVIAPNTGGIPEHLSKEFGCLVEVGNEMDLEKSIIYLLDNASAFSSEKLRNYAVKHFGEAEISENFADLYTEILGLKKKTMNGPDQAKK